MEKMKLETYSEDRHLDYHFDDDLSYAEVIDKEDDVWNEVILYNKGKAVGLFIVWCDSEMDREYITINHTIVYLDTLTKKDNVSEDLVEPL